MVIRRFYVYPAVSDQHLCNLLKNLSEIENVNAESCFYVDFSSVKLNDDDLRKIRWFLGENFPGLVTIRDESIFDEEKPNEIILEFGPRLNFTTAFSTNAVSALNSAGLNEINRVEKSIRYFLRCSKTPKESEIEIISSVLHDRMTECRYETPIENFELKKITSSFLEIDVLKGGKNAVEDANQKFGLALDSWDIEFYYDIFVNKIQRNPTNIELFDLAQSNSEHSRHWFFKGRLIVDGVETEKSLLQMVIDTQKYSNQNNVIKFSDNSSGIQGKLVKIVKPRDPSKPQSFFFENCLKHIIYTAETHNFPTGVCPFPGASTGTGGRIRDVQAAGRGGHVVAGVAGYSFGNLNIPSDVQPWENSKFRYPSNFASPLDICIQASNGASDYGNKFGEPVICGFARSFGLLLQYTDEKNDAQVFERVEYVKPIMFSGGLGVIDDEMLRKTPPEKGMLVVKLGGPAYRIGVGGGSASSVEIQGSKNRCESLDFGAVQRGDAEMEQKLNRVIRSCLEFENNTNPIQSIHDQGAGGNGNVLKELVEGAGAKIYCDEFQLGDPTMNVLELWGAEYQESNAILINPDDRERLNDVCRREKCPVSYVGEVTGDNKIVLVDFDDKLSSDTEKRYPVDLNLDLVLGSVPRKVFKLESYSLKTPKLILPADISFKEALQRVLRLPSVASKRYLTNKVDRSVTGLIAQQQCVGPLHTPLADVAVTALSYFDTVGSAVAIGEQPLKILVDPRIGARMTLGEALTNLIFAPITDLQDVKCSANWMWPAKLPGEGARLLAACDSMCTVMNDLGVAVDGGKDSLSMAARVDDTVVKSPGTLVISGYAQCTDITRIATPDLKCPDGNGILIYVPFGGGEPASQLSALGGSALAQCFGQIGSADDLPDLLDAKKFSAAFKSVQELIRRGAIVAGHDVSDGGLICCCFEMAFAGNCAILLNFPFIQDSSPLNLFSESLGIVIEVPENQLDTTKNYFNSNEIDYYEIGNSRPQFGPEAKMQIRIGKNQTEIFDGSMVSWRNVWEETSFQLEKFQCNVSCAEQEHEYKSKYKLPPLKWDSSLSLVRQVENFGHSATVVGVVREEGSNGDREMVAAFVESGFDVWDVTMQDLLSDLITLDRFDGLAFVGGFSFADVFGAAKGWAGAILYHEKIKRQFEWFRRNERKFSFGVCNGCQLMALLGWVGSESESESSGQTGSVVLNTNLSERFESRFCYVRIDESPSVMLKQMAGSVLGVWVAHGEGKFLFQNESELQKILSSNLAPVKYVDESAAPTETYPMNPNGSPYGVAALCSADGRHLAIMPHPERCFLKWQWPYWPRNFCERGDTCLRSPWTRLFDNAYTWCCLNR